MANRTFDQHFNAMTRGMEDHQFRHYNRALGMFIESKEQYKRELIRRGLVPCEMAEQLCEKWQKEHPRKEYKLSDKGQRLINHFKNTARNGYIKLAEHPKAIAELKSMGMDYERNLDEFIKQH